MSPDRIHLPLQRLFDELEADSNGLNQEEAERRLKKYGRNEPAKKKKRSILKQFFSKFLNPLVVVLVIIGTLSLYFGEKIEALLVLAMVLISVLLSFIQEYRSGRAAENLAKMVHTKCTVLRSGEKKELNIQEVVPGDVVELCAGDMIPADLRILSCKDLFVNQASLTGESFPVEKFAGDADPASGVSSMPSNTALMGSSVVSGSSFGLVIGTGGQTQFGQISGKLVATDAQTSFETGLNQFVWLMIRFMIVLVVAIFVINILSKGNLVEALLFSLAVAVGLTPEMLPMIVAVNLSKGALAMSKKKAIVKKLNSIQNLGSMDVLCTDKTGTLTLDQVVLEKYCDVVGNENEDVLKFACINSFYQTGLKNLLDKAITNHKSIDVSGFRKVDEIPFDFSRRIMSVVVEMDGQNRLISKGAPEEIFKRCTHYQLDDEINEIDDLILSDLKEEYDKLSSDGFRVLAVSSRDVVVKSAYSKEDESQMVLKGYIAFLDPPKPGAKEVIPRLNKLGIRIVVMTGDNELVTKKICSEVGLDAKDIVTGDRIGVMTDDELNDVIRSHTVFARLNPLQKEKLVQVFHRNKHIVGFLGDGINDAPSLKAADVGISVDNAVDIAKESADIILLEKDLSVLADGVIEGRKTFGNTIKYIKMGASSNFGNMISMTGASLFLPFLPMTPIQILLNNLLYDFSQVALPSDEVDKEYLDKPRPWDIAAIRKFMVVFGPVSSAFDFLTFGVLLYFFKSSQILFHTGWFLESLATQTIVIHIIRTSKIPFIESRPSRFLLLMSIFIIGVGFALPFSPLAPHIGFERPPLLFFGILFGIIVAYVVAAQTVKVWYVKKYEY